MLKVEHLTKVYPNGTVALKDLSFEVEDGEFLVILGPAGAGKTTTLKVIAGLFKPTRGRVFIDGKDVTDVPGNLRNIAMTFEDYALYPTFSVYQNLENPFGAMQNSLSKQEIDKKVHEVARMLQIDHLLDRKVDQLSGGQKQRVSLARSMVREPQCFLFDEPLSHVDAKIRHAMRAELHRMASVMKTTTIYVTHDYVEALSLADRIVVIDKGVIQQVGTPHEIYNQPANEFVATIVGQPNINMFILKVEAENGHIQLTDPQDPDFSFTPRDDVQAVLSKYKGNLVKVGIRPQDIKFSILPMKSKSFTGKVELFELWGYRGMVLASIGKKTLRILASTDHAIDEDQPIWLDVSESPLYLFDENGTRLE